MLEKKQRTEERRNQIEIPSVRRSSFIVTKGINKAFLGHFFKSNVG